MGTLHAQKFAQMPGVQVVAVADVDGRRAAALASQLGCDALADWRRGLERADVAVVAVPAPAHVEVLRACIASRLHVLVEKPLATDAQAAADLIALAAREHVVLQVAHVERFNTAFLAIGPRFDQPMFIDTERLAEFGPRGSDVDVVLDLMIHDIDLALALARSDVTEIRACGFGVLTDGIDIANVYLEFRSGCVANLSASRVSQSTVRKLRVFQQDLYASVDLQAGHVRYVKRGARSVEQSDESFPKGDPLALQDQAFVAAVRGQRPVPVTGDDGRRAIEIALAVGQRVRERLQRFAVPENG